MVEHKEKNGVYFKAFSNRRIEPILKGGSSTKELQDK
jgi:hypothetical protein